MVDTHEPDAPDAASAPDGDAPLEDETAPPAGYLANLIGALVPLALGIGGLVLASQLGLGSLGEPGPGLWPGLISIALSIASIALVVGGRRFHDAESFTRSSLLVVVATATLVALVAAMPYTGFEIPSALLAFVWLRFLGRERWWVSIVGAIAMTAVFWLLFVQLFAIPLPHLI